MDTTIRNLDPDVYRRLKAHAALTGKSIGEAVNEAIRLYLARRPHPPKVGSLASWKPVQFPAGNERLSEEIDSVVYGVDLR
jgi:plasmid stability protein